MKELSCRVAQNGYCAGPVHIFRTPAKTEFALSNDIGEDKEKLKRSVDLLEKQLNEQIAVSTSDNAKILEADLSLLQDDTFVGSIIKVIDEKHSQVSYAIQEGCRNIADSFEKSGSEYIRQRSSDILGLGQKLIDIAEDRKNDLPSKPSVLVAEELTPQDFASFKPGTVLGLITLKGSYTSHVSIMAGNMGIPYVHHVDSLEEFYDGLYVIVDTGRKIIILDPDEQTMDKAEETVRKQKETQEKVQNNELATRIFANISNAENPDALKNSGADGVGLFRTEFLFLERDCAPTEDEQYEAYTAVCRAVGSREVIIRTMDIGSDKKACWLPMSEEKNPALGNRGIRLSFMNPDLFRIQLRALLRAAVCGNLKIMFPMITSEWEVDEIRQTISEVETQLKEAGVPCRVPSIGIMIETPAAAVIADKLAGKVDFFSIGTNDLTQYTLALDREAEGLDKFFLPHHEALLRLIRMVVEAGHKAGIPTGICGEAGSDPEMIPEFVKMGVDELSVPPAKVQSVREIVSRAERNVFMELEIPCDGILIPMEKIKDDVFSSGMLGQAIGIFPKDSIVYAPVSGKLINFTETKHAFTIETADGRQILIHAGIDTVKLNGKGFEKLANNGDEIRKGQPVLKMDLNLIKQSGYDPTVIVVILS